MTGEFTEVCVTRIKPKEEMANPNIIETVFHKISITLDTILEKINYVLNHNSKNQIKQILMTMV